MGRRGSLFLGVIGEFFFFMFSSVIDDGMVWLTGRGGRFHFVYEFLGLPYRDVTLLPPPGEGKAKL
jgi:hypothetical protein